MTHFHTAQLVERFFQEKLGITKPELHLALRKDSEAMQNYHDLLKWASENQNSQRELPQC
jgi:hypothetical protein